MIGTINNAYLFYTVATSVPMADLVRAACILAKKNGFDVFTALGIGEVLPALQSKSCQFVRGTGLLRYYLFNWREMQIEQNNVHFVAL